VVCKCMCTHMYVVDLSMRRVNVYTHTCVYGRFCMYVVWMYVGGMYIGVVWMYVCKCLYTYVCLWEILYVRGMKVCVRYRHM